MSTNEELKILEARKEDAERFVKWGSAHRNTRALCSALAVIKECEEEIARLKGKPANGE